MKVKKAIVYECPECSTIYDNDIDARECCVTIDPQDGWQCGECEELYLDKEDAKECCR